MTITLKGDAEWSDARKEAVELLGDRGNPLDSGKLGEIYRWITKQEHLGKTWTSSELAKRFKVDAIRKLLSKLYLFRDNRIRITSRNHWETEVNVSKEPLPEWTLTPVNPVFPEIPKEFSRDDLETLRLFFEDLVLDRDEAGSLFLVARMSTRREVKQCFRVTSGDSLDGGSYPEVLSKMPAIRGLHMFYCFAADLGLWHSGFQLSEDYTWEEVKGAIRQRRLEKPPEEKYGLSEEASRVLTWLLNEDYENFERLLSPAVEDSLKLEIGIDLKTVGEKNLWPLFQLICEEITEKTEFEAKPISWAEGYYGQKMHLFFREKPNIEEHALDAVQRLLRTWGVEQGRKDIRTALLRLKDQKNS